jgi:predicted DCC family thiol-disulfide oxidoreductase YuxK
MKFAPLQGEFAKAVRARHPELAGVDSFVLVERGAGSGERVSVRSEATFAIARYLGGPWRLAEILRVVPRFLRDWAYDQFARYRYRLFGRHQTCPVPDPAVRERFLV